MILAYNGDYGQKPAPAAQPAVAVQEQAQDVPDTSDAMQAHTDAPNPANPLAVHSVEAKADASHLIQVVTDTLVVVIDLRGGKWCRLSCLLTLRLLISLKHLSLC